MFSLELACSSPTHSSWLQLPCSTLTFSCHAPPLACPSFCSSICSSICDPCHMPCATLWRCVFLITHIAARLKEQRKNASTAQGPLPRYRTLTHTHTSRYPRAPTPGCVWHSSRANPNGNMRKLSRLLFTEIIKRVKCSPKSQPIQPCGTLLPQPYSFPITVAQPLAQKWRRRQRRRQNKI